MKRVMLVMAVVLMSALQVEAQTTKVADKELHGAWLMQSMQFEGEKKSYVVRRVAIASLSTMVPMANMLVHS
ncbi:MAG: hypothetical protein IJL54_02040 [Prevotella sp.]|nr:hypothetical protein [Prevotella sp.]